MAHKMVVNREESFWFAPSSIQFDSSKFNDRTECRSLNHWPQIWIRPQRANPNDAWETVSLQIVYDQNKCTEKDTEKHDE